MSLERPLLHEWRTALLASELPTRHKLVGVALAEYADTATGRNAFAGVRTIARLASCHRDSASRSLAELVSCGWLEGTTRPRQTTVYTLTFPSGQTRDLKTARRRRSSSTDKRKEAAYLDTAIRR